MVAPTDSITLILPRASVEDVLKLSANLLERMHDLLERNTDARLSSVEQEELETLVQMAEFGQLVSMAVQPNLKP